MSTTNELEVKVKFRSKIILSKKAKLYLSMFDVDLETEYFDYRYNKLMTDLIGEKVTKEYVKGYVDSMKDRISVANSALKNKNLDLKKQAGQKK